MLDGSLQLWLQDRAICALFLQNATEVLRMIVVMAKYATILKDEPSELNACTQGFTATEVIEGTGQIQVCC